MKKFAFIAGLFFFALLLGCNACNKDCESGNLEFDLPLQVEGFRDTLHLGDSLLVRFSIPDKLPDRRFGDVYEFNDYNFLLKTYIGKIDTVPTGTETNVYFDWKNVKGTTNYVGGTHLIFPVFEGNSYHYEAIIKPREKGLFVFGMNSSKSRLNPLKDVTGGPCSRNSVFLFMKLTNTEDPNFEFLKQSPDQVQANIGRKRFDEFAGFCFYVK